MDTIHKEDIKREREMENKYGWWDNLVHFFSFRWVFPPFG